MTTLGLLTVSGIDAKRLLQGQLTCDMEHITPTQGSFAAHCNPQGRIVSFFYLCMHDGAYCLIMPRNMIDIAMQALKKYAVFYKVNLLDASDSLPLIIDQYPKQALKKGIPTIYPNTSGKFLPHEIHLHQVGNAISFEKGCYTGQEIIARMQYRGKLKNHLYFANINADTPLQPGDDIFCLMQENKQAVGVVVDAAINASQQYDALILTDEQYAKENYLFADNTTNTFFNLKNTLGEQQ